MSKAADEVRTPLSGRFYGAPDTVKDEGNLRPGEPTGTAGGLHRAHHPKGLVGLFVSVPSMGAPLGVQVLLQVGHREPSEAQLREGD